VLGKPGLGLGQGVAHIRAWIEGGRPDGEAQRFGLVKAPFDLVFLVDILGVDGDLTPAAWFSVARSSSLASVRLTMTTWNPPGAKRWATVAPPPAAALTPMMTRA